MQIVGRILHLALMAGMLWSALFFAVGIILPA